MRLSLCSHLRTSLVAPVAALVTFTLACGSRTSLEATLASPPADASPGPTPDGEPPPHDAGDSSSLPSCAEPPWVLFAVNDNSIDQGPDSYSLYARHPDGTGGHTVMLPHPNALYPSISTDGASLVYASWDLTALYVYRFGATSDVTLATNGGSVGFGSLSPDNTQVAYGDAVNLWLVRADGTGSARMIPLAAQLTGGTADEPVFAPGSQTVVFGGLATIDSVHVDGTAAETLITSNGTDDLPSPTFSPDHQTLATVVTCDGTTYTLRTYTFASLPASCESGGIVTVIPLDTFETIPAWGPTGVIAYSDGTDIFLVDATGGTPTTLTTDLSSNNESCDEPTWVPGCVKL